MRSLNVIGLNSGTSMDGIDAALFRISPVDGKNNAINAHIPKLTIELISSLLEPFDPRFRERLQKLIAGKSALLKDICLLNTALGELFAKAAMSLIKQSSENVDLIGSHGQTIWHSPKRQEFWGIQTSGTLQLGEPAVIALRTGIPVVADFRPADVAAGGEGAPLLSFADEVLFGLDNIPTGILNIGGIANITVIDSKGNTICAYDTGPGNMIIDRVAQQLMSIDYDVDGKVAETGTIDQMWLSQLLSHPYFSIAPPKTTGRELFGNAYADILIGQAESKKLKIADCLATTTALTARSIADSYRQLVMPQVRIDRLILGGGGTDNSFLVKLLVQSWPHPVSIHRHEEFGVSTKFKEALLFALLAYTTFLGIPNNVPHCTGARRRLCLGKLIKV